MSTAVLWPTVMKKLISHMKLMFTMDHNYLMEFTTFLSVLLCLIIFPVPLKAMLEMWGMKLRDKLFETGNGIIESEKWLQVCIKIHGSLKKSSPNLVFWNYNLSWCKLIKISRIVRKWKWKAKNRASSNSTSKDFKELPWSLWPVWCIFVQN